MGFLRKCMSAWIGLLLSMLSKYFSRLRSNSYLQSHLSIAALAELGTFTLTSVELFSHGERPTAFRGKQGLAGLSKFLSISCLAYPRSPMPR